MADPFYDPTAAFQPIYTQSLFDKKKEILNSRIAEKQERLAPSEVTTGIPDTNPVVNPVVNPYLPNNPMSLAGGAFTPEQSNGNSNYLDIMESGFRQTGTNISDIFTGEERTNAENRADADLASGVSLQDRERLVDAPQRRVTESLAEGNYWDVLKNSVLAAPATISDSSGSIGTAVATTAAIAGTTALAPAVASAIGITALANKAYKLYKGANAIVDAVDKTKKASKLITASKAVAKSAAQVSVMNADLTQRQVNDFREKNSRNPTTSEVAQMYLVNLSTTIFEPAIIKNLVIPNFAKHLKNDITTAIKSMSKDSSLVSIAKRLGKGVVKLGAAGTAEGLQEYAQTWGEIINVNATAAQKGEFWNAVKAEINNPENQFEAKLGAALGFGAGSGTKGLTTVPAVGIGVAADATVGTAKTTFKLGKKAVLATNKFASERNAKKLSKYLSDEQTNEIRNEYEIAKAQHEEFKTSTSARKETLSKATSFADITDPDLEEELGKVAKTDDLNNEKVFNRVKNSIIREYESDVALSKIKLESNFYYKIAASKTKQASEEAVLLAKKAAAFVNLPDDAIEQVITAAKVVSTAAIEELKTFNTSATYGLAEKAVSYGNNATKEGLQSLEAEVRENTPETIRKLSNALSSTMPKLSAKLDTLADRRERASLSSGRVVEGLVNLGGLSPVIKSVARRQAIPVGSMSAVAAELLEVSKVKLEDIDTVETVQKVLDLYTSNESYSPDSSNSLDKETLDTINRKLDRYRKVFKGTVAGKVASAAEKVTEVAKSTATKVESLVSSIINSSIFNSEDKTDSEVTDVDTKTSYVIKTSPQTNKFIAGLKLEEQKRDALTDPADKEAMLADTIKLVSSTKFIQAASKLFETTEAGALLAIMVNVLPDIGKKGNIESYRGSIETALKTADTQTETETTQRDSSVPVPPSGQLEVDENGMWLIDEIVTDEQLDEFIDNNFSKDDVCAV